RIVAVADAYEVMTTVRSYKKAMTAVAARAELAKQAGSQFDPVIVRAFLNVSLGKQRWVMGPVTWIAQLPFIGWVPRLAEGAATMAGPAAGMAGAAASAAVLSAATMSVGFRDGELPPIPNVIENAPAATPPAGSQSPSGLTNAEVLGESLERDRSAGSPAKAVDSDPPGNSEKARDELTPTRPKDDAPNNSGPAATSDKGEPLDLDPATPGVQPFVPQKEPKK
ncbi:MAG: HD-GYP domain-containing protein, partial [Acidimicrobiia bacterium]